MRQLSIHVDDVPEQILMGMSPDTKEIMLISDNSQYMQIIRLNKNNANDYVTRHKQTYVSV